MRKRMKKTNSVTGMDSKKILSEINQLKMFAELIINKATMLEQGLSNVVLDKPTRKGLSESHIKNVLGNREKRRLQ